MNIKQSTARITLSLPTAFVSTSSAFSSETIQLLQRKAPTAYIQRVLKIQAYKVFARFFRNFCISTEWRCSAQHRPLQNVRHHEIVQFMLMVVPDHFRSIYIFSNFSSSHGIILEVENYGLIFHFKH